MDKTSVAVEAELQPVRFGNLTQAPLSNSCPHPFSFCGNESGCFPTLSCQPGLAFEGVGRGFVVGGELDVGPLVVSSANFFVPILVINLLLPRVLAPRLVLPRFR